MSATTALIVALRQQAKLSQSEISRRTGIPQPRISRWEAGDTPDSADDALRLQALHTELIGNVGAPAIPTTQAAPAAEQQEARHAA